MGVTVVIDSLEDMCALMCDNIIPDGCELEDTNLEDNSDINVGINVGINDGIKKGANE